MLQYIQRNIKYIELKNIIYIANYFTSFTIVVKMKDLKM